MSRTLLPIIVFFLLFTCLGVAYAERYVVVNGHRLSIPEIQNLERIRCGPIPNGRYWLNMWNGIWGYEGNPHPQGHITDNCHRPQRRPSLSERGMLFSPGDWIR
ncbi:MAG: hypothetical protein MRJ96_08345 [Nitrospirales bacterium]|nr:hypothetical protein [Nitrospira sp.]MDR4501442.1 hypothetical protein [Nitrospirales bacterium]